jgi:uncharacterized protein YbaR (Trm112 family)
MQIDGWLLDILACPECHAPLRVHQLHLRPGVPGSR